MKLETPTPRHQSRIKPKFDPDNSDQHEDNIPNLLAGTNGKQDEPVRYISSSGTR